MALDGNDKKEVLQSVNASRPDSALPLAPFTIGTRRAGSVVACESLKDCPASSRPPASGRGAAGAVEQERGTAMPPPDQRTRQSATNAYSTGLEHGLLVSQVLSDITGVSSSTLPSVRYRLPGCFPHTSPLLDWVDVEHASEGSARSYAARSFKTHAWWNTTIPLGSRSLVAAVERAVAPKPSGTSAMLKTTTPWCSGVSSVMRPRCALTMWLPYRNGSSPAGLIQIWR